MEDAFGSSGGMEQEGRWMNTREKVLEAAKACVTGQREEDYGTPEDNFGMIARLWTAYGYPVTKKDVALMMLLLKVARAKAGGTEDCYVDMAGYAACGAEIASGE